MIEPKFQFVGNKNLQFGEHLKLTVCMRECDKLSFKYGEFAIIRRGASLHCEKI